MSGWEAGPGSRRWPLASMPRWLPTRCCDPSTRPAPTAWPRPRPTCAAFLIQYWGGPDDYSRDRGHPRLRMRHGGFAIDVEARNAWFVHMADAVVAGGHRPRRRGRNAGLLRHGRNPHDQSDVTGGVGRPWWPTMPQPAPEGHTIPAGMAPWAGGRGSGRGRVVVILDDFRDFGRPEGEKGALVVQDQPSRPRWRRTNRRLARANHAHGTSGNAGHARLSPPGDRGVLSRV